MRPHWPDVMDVFLALAYLTKNTDPDGIELLFTNQPTKHYKSKRTTDLMKTLESQTPKGECNMQLRLGQILQDYQERLETFKDRRRSIPFIVSKPRPTSIYILTNGIWQPGPEPVCGVDELIKIQVSKPVEQNLLDAQVGIQFISFGNDHNGMNRLQLLDSGHGLGFKRYVFVKQRCPMTSPIS
jgi:hypothetical protein